MQTPEIPGPPKSNKGFQRLFDLHGQVAARVRSFLGHNRTSRLGAFLLTPWHYLKSMIWEADQAYGFALVRAAWETGWLGRSGLVALLVGLSLVSITIGHVSIPSSSTLTTFTLAGFAVAWAFAFTASARAPLWAYVLANVYLLFYAILVGGDLAGTAPFGIPTWIVLAWGWVLARASGSRFRRLWFWILCLVAGNLTFNAIGLARLIPEDWNLVGRVALGLVYGGLLANPLTLPSRRIPVAFADLTVFITGLAGFSLFFTLAYARDPGLTADNLLLSFRGLLGLVDLAWFWLGWTLFEGALDLGAWVSDRTLRILTPGVGEWLLPSFWGISAAFCWLAVHPVPLPFAVMAYSIGLQNWVASIADSLYYALSDFFFVALLLLFLVVVLARLKRLDHKRIGWINGLWIATFAALLWYYQSMSSFATLEVDAAAPLNLWTGFLLVGGIIWELARSGAAYLELDSRPRVFAILSGLLFLLTISSLLLALGLPDLVMEYTLYSFLGVLYLGLPLALYTALPGLFEYEPVSGLRLLALFGLGMVSAVLVMGLAYNAGPHLALIPAIWALIFWWVGRPLARLQLRLDGIAGGSALALGFSVYWMSPQLLPVPFLTWVNEWQLRYLLQPLNRPMMQSGQFWFTLLFVLAGGAVGLAFTSRKHRRLTIGFAVLGSALLLALVVPWIPGIPRVDPLLF